MRVLLRPALLTAIAAVRLAAQADPPTGLASIAFSAGAGNGALKFGCDGCAATAHPTAHPGQLWMARISIANTAKTIVGVEYDHWQRTSTSLVTDPVTLDLVPTTRTTSVSWVAAAVQYYPVADGRLSGAYARGALGLTTIELDPRTTLKNIGGGAGVGWDIALTKQLAVTPWYDVLVAQKSKVPGRFPVSQPAPSVGAFMTSFGVSLKFKGLP